MSAGGSTGGNVYVWIKLATAKEDAFAYLTVELGELVGSLIERACSKYTHWQLNAGQVRLHPVTVSGEEPSEEEIGAARATNPLAVSAAVPSGAWLVASSTHPVSPSSSFVPGRLSFGGGGGGGGTTAEHKGPTLLAAKLPSVSEAVGPTFEQEARDVVSALFRELCPWTTDHSPLLSRTLDSGGMQREADIMCYVHGDTLVPCMALAGHGARLAELPCPALPALPPMPLPADQRFSPTDAMHTGPHKYFLAEVYSGQTEAKWVEKAQQLDTLCEFLMARWQDRHPGMPAVTDVTQIVGAAALIFSAGASSRKEVLLRAHELVAAHIAAHCPNLARLAAAGRLLVMMLDKSQAPITLFQRSVATHLESIPEELAGVRREMVAGLSGLAAQVESLAAAVRNMK